MKTHEQGQMLARDSDMKLQVFILFNLASKNPALNINASAVVCHRDSYKFDMKCQYPDTIYRNIHLPVENPQANIIVCVCVCVCVAR